MTGNWNIWAISLSTGFKDVTFLSSNKISPLEGLINPEIIFKSVVFPHPEGPNKAYAPPSFQSMLMSLNTKSTSV